MNINWRELTDGLTEYIYSGGTNPFDHSGEWVNPDTFHAIRMLGCADTWQDSKGRDLCIIESLELVCNGKKSIRESLSAIGQDVSEWLKMPKQERRTMLCFALLAYGHYDPANEFPDSHEVQTHRESAAFRAVNNFMR